VGVGFWKACKMQRKQGKKRERQNVASTTWMKLTPDAVQMLPSDTHRAGDTLR